jgi:hypothetical protein
VVTVVAHVLAVPGNRLEVSQESARVRDHSQLDVVARTILALSNAHAAQNERDYRLLVGAVN